MRRFLAIGAVAGLAILMLSGPAQATAAKSVLFHDGTTIRTVVPPSAFPNQGRDPFYSVTNGVDGQLAKAAELGGVGVAVAVDDGHVGGTALVVQAGAVVGLEAPPGRLGMLVVDVVGLVGGRPEVAHRHHLRLARAGRQRDHDGE